MTLEEFITKINSISRHRFDHFDCDKKIGGGYRGNLRVFITNNKKSLQNHHAYYNSEGDSVSELLQNLYDELVK